MLLVLILLPASTSSVYHTDSILVLNFIAYRNSRNVQPVAYVVNNCSTHYSANMYHVADIVGTYTFIYIISIVN